MLVLLSGKKTFLIAGAMALYALVGALAGWITWEQATQLILNAAALAGLRSAIRKGE